MRRLVAGCLLAVVLSTTASACLWDYDTLAMELRRFPTALELITGKFLRHSTAFYEWRAEDRRRKLEQEPESLKWTDDLAVAYDKLGRHDEAVELMRKALEKDGERYETHANLGTFLIHSGELKAGLEHIERAIEINPDAHFGREIYQAQLVRYVLASRSEEEQSLSFPLAKEEPEHSFAPIGFSKFLIEQDGDDPEKKQKQEQLQAERDKAVRGVLGMMRFGHYDSPVLLEVLGDLLLTSENDDAKRLAARAYLKASYEAQGEAAAAYRKKAEAALKMQVRGRGNYTEVQLGEIETRLKREIVDAESWAAKVHADEVAWISAGVDVDAAFSKKYYEEPEVYATAVSPIGATPWWIVTLCAFGLAIVLGAVSLMLVMRSLRGVQPLKAGKPAK